MAYSNFTRKQAGVLFRANKDGKIKMTDAGIKMVYARADAQINHDARLDSVERCLREAVDAIFAGNDEEARKHVGQAAKEYASIYGENAEDLAEVPKETMTRYDLIVDGELIGCEWSKRAAEERAARMTDCIVRATEVEF